jgi:hypothetical protein
MSRGGLRAAMRQRLVAARIAIPDYATSRS